jgi:hypothetical protein
MIFKIMLTSLLFSILTLVSAAVEKEIYGDFSAVTTIVFGISFAVFVLTLIASTLGWIWL